MSDVFGPAYAGAYDLFYAGKDYEAECDILERAFREFAVEPVRRIIDLGCGTGGHSIPLAYRGYEVVAVDRAPGMLSAAREKAIASDVDGRITFVPGDVTSPPDVAPCDAAIMMFNVLGYQTAPADVTATLNAVSRVLRPGSLFVFDVWHAEAIELDPPVPRHRVYEQGGNQWLRRSSGELDRAAEVCTVTIQAQRLVDGRTASETVEHHRVRYFTRETLVELLNASGMELLRLGHFPEYWLEADKRDWNVMGVARVTA